MVSPQDASDGTIERAENSELELFRDGGRLIADHELRDIESVADLMDLITDSEEPALDAADFVGSGSELLKDKERLVSVPFWAVQWRFNQSDDYEDAWFVSVQILTEHGEKFVINDGTQGGIRDQLHAVTRKTGKMNFFRCSKGLTVSEYTVIEDGKKKKARSYYIAA